MARFILIICLVSSFISCKSDNNEQNTSKAENKPLTVAQKIANAHGFKNWNKVSRIEFTFNVDRDSSHFERSWIWKPNVNEVTMVSKSDTISYIRTKLDSINLNTDKAFINDKYWLLAPFNLVWDEGTNISEPIKKEAPISKDLLNKITLTYANEGGYTPGDAYDFYYGKDFLIREWVYRKSNSEKPSLINTWENYQNFNGIKIALEHKKLEGNWNLNFTNIKVTLE
ncbi:MAG: hypothetical protein DRI75_02130 [Bacteroidetes bacterium]|nr:MAG: hypothetical protein DRI75_02130 [Bacteroidota bacterium]